jgi:hypothetical protein
MILQNDYDTPSGRTLPSWRSMSDADDLSDNTNEGDKLQDPSMHGDRSERRHVGMAAIVHHNEPPRNRRASLNSELERTFKPLVEEHSRFLINFVLTMRSNSLNNKIRNDQVCICVSAFSVLFVICTYTHTHTQQAEQRPGISLYVFFHVHHHLCTLFIASHVFGFDPWIRKHATTTCTFA